MFGINLFSKSIFEGNFVTTDNSKKFPKKGGQDVSNSLSSSIFKIFIELVPECSHNPAFSSSGLMLI